MPRQKTPSWSLLMLLKNEEEEWMPLNQLEQPLPLETAEFDVAEGIDDEVFFK